MCSSDNSQYTYLRCCCCFLWSLSVDVFRCRWDFCVWLSVAIIKKLKLKNNQKNSGNNNNDDDEKNNIKLIDIETYRKCFRSCRKKFCDWFFICLSFFGSVYMCAVFSLSFGDEYIYKLDVLSMLSTFCVYFSLSIRSNSRIFI